MLGISVAWRDPSLTYPIADHRSKTVYLDAVVMPVRETVTVTSAIIAISREVISVISVVWRDLLRILSQFHAKCRFSPAHTMLRSAVVVLVFYLVSTVFAEK